MSSGGGSPAVSRCTGWSRTARPEVAVSMEGASRAHRLGVGSHHPASASGLGAAPRHAAAARRFQALWPFHLQEAERDHHVSEGRCHRVTPRSHQSHHWDHAGKGVLTSSRNGTAMPTAQSPKPNFWSAVQTSSRCSTPMAVIPWTRQSWRSWRIRFPHKKRRSVKSTLSLNPGGKDKGRAVDRRVSVVPMRPARYCTMPCAQSSTRLTGMVS